MKIVCAALLWLSILIDLNTQNLHFWAAIIQKSTHHLKIDLICFSLLENLDSFYSESNILTFSEMQLLSCREIKVQISTSHIWTTATLLHLHAPRICHISQSCKPLFFWLLKAHLHLSQNVKLTRMMCFI